MYGTWIVFSRQLLRVMLLLTMIGSSASAQRYFDAPFRSFDATNREWAQEGLTCVAAADMNGDGLPDAVAGQLGIAPPGFPPGIDGVYVYLNQGSVDGAPATFSAPVRYPVLYDPLDVALADIDADGDLDVVLACFFNDIGAFGGNIAILRNNGDGSLQTATYLDTGIHGAHGVCAGDLDGDGDVDLAVTNHGRSGTTISVFANLGNGAFAPRITYETGAADPNGIAAADLDNDGDLDLAVAHDEPARVSILFNDGTGVFGEPSGYPGIFPEVNDGEYGSLVVFDADLDGDSDIAYTSTFAYDEYEDDGKIAILRNNGNGVFSVDLYPYLLPFRDAAVDLAAADLDGDGFVDLLGAEFEEPGLISFINDGTGGFLGARVIPSAGDAFAVAVADLDLDGDPDGLDINRFYPVAAAHENPGDGEFPVPPVFGALPFHGALELGDVDNDGHIDAATSHSGAASSRVMVHLGRGDGSFEESYQTSGFAYAYAQLHHLDSDGNLDLLFVSGPNAPPYDFFTARGNGDGTFQTVTRWIVNTCGSGHPAAYDIDEDGDLDVINTEDRGCSGSVQKYLYVSRNNGDGTFQSPYTIPIEFATRYVAAGDFDEDGHLDLVTGWPNWSLLRGHGDGTFDPEEPLPGASGSENTIPIDLDGDGHLDLATVGTEDLATAWLYVLWGDGSGGFSVSTFGGFPSPSGRVWLAAGDVDQDGDLDVMVDGVNDAVVMSNEDHREFQYRGRYGIGPASVSVHYADTDTDSLGDLIALAGGGITVIRGAVPLDPAATGEPGGAVSGGGPVLRSLSANPTRGLVRFSLELDTPEHFRIAVFDVQGRRMDLVHDGEVDRGAHAFAIDTSNWPSGVYSVRATATSGAVSERIVVR